MERDDNSTIRVAELFAGVGGFRLGLEGWKDLSALSGYTEKLESRYKVVWSNQWEPSTKKQHASDIYAARFGEEAHNNLDITTVRASDIPEHDLLVGGFPCQDYSVANRSSTKGGLNGRKGKMWWEIHRILKEKIEAGQMVKYALFENVDQLLNTPKENRGLDFATILASLSDLGYAVEWRVINAADYGMPQRRKRIFMLAFHKTTTLYDELKNIKHPGDWLCLHGVLAKAFPVIPEGQYEFIYS